MNVNINLRLKNCFICGFSHMEKGAGIKYKQTMRLLNFINICLPVSMWKGTDRNTLIFIVRISLFMYTRLRKYTLQINHGEKYEYFNAGPV